MSAVEAFNVVCCTRARLIARVGALGDIHGCGLDDADDPVRYTRTVTGHEYLTYEYVLLLTPALRWHQRPSNATASGCLHSRGGGVDGAGVRLGLGWLWRKVAAGERHHWGKEVHVQKEQRAVRLPLS